VIAGKAFAVSLLWKFRAETPPCFWNSKLGYPHETGVSFSQATRSSIENFKSVRNTDFFYILLI